MSVSVSRGRLFRITTAIDDERLKAMRAAPELAERALAAGAQFWHEKILRRHFDPDAHGRYDYARRAQNYRKQKAGRPDLVYSGSLRSDLLGYAAFQRTGRSLTLKLTARVLNFVPRMNENDDSYYVQHGGKSRGGGRGYPNLKREVKAFTAEDRAKVAAAVDEELSKAMNGEHAAA